jgi:hypothetical protein
MNAWMKDPRVDQAAFDAFEAERAERRGDLADARARHHAAADAFAAVALTVPADYPNTRSDLAIAAVASYARAGDFGRATELSRRVLAESAALTEHGRAELSRMMREYLALLGPPGPPAGRKPAANRGSAVRDEVRGQFPRAA